MQHKGLTVVYLTELFQRPLQKTEQHEALWQEGSGRGGGRRGDVCNDLNTDEAPWMNDFSSQCICCKWRLNWWSLTAQPAPVQLYRGAFHWEQVPRQPAPRFPSSCASPFMHQPPIIYVPSCQLSSPPHLPSAQRGPAITVSTGNANYAGSKHLWFPMTKIISEEQSQEPVICHNAFTKICSGIF